jgi:predicted DNA-binding WGR domain protein
MPRYEFSEGSSNKFWQIDLSGKSFTTTYGKIGTDGQTTIKTWKTEAEAKKEYDKLIAEKVKKGYEPVDGDDDDVDEDEDEDEDMEDEEEEEAPPKKSAKTAPAAKTAAKTVAKPAAKPAAKAPAKPAAKPAAKAAPKASDKSSPRYFEFSEGTSNKFWQIWMEGTSVLTKYGRIGAAGSTTVKDFGDDAKANKEYDKLVNEKTKKGYEEKDLPDGGGDDDEDMDDDE